MTRLATLQRLTGTLLALRSRRDEELAANGHPRRGGILYLALRLLRLLRLPGVARLLLRHPDLLGKPELWYDHTLANTQKLHRAGVNHVPVVCAGCGVATASASCGVTTIGHGSNSTRAWLVEPRPRPGAVPLR